MSELEDKIKQDVEKSIKNQKEEKLSFQIIKKELFDFAPKLKSKMTVSIILACIGEVLGFAAYFFAAYTANNLITNTIDFSKVIMYACITILLLLSQNALTSISSMKSHAISFTILKNIRVAMSEKLTKVPLGYVLAKPIGHYKALIVERVGSLEDWIAHVMPEMPSRMLHPILATLILFILDYRLGLACFVSIPFMMLAMMLMMYKQKERMFTWMNSNQELNARTIEYVNGISVIKAFGRANSSYEKFTAAADYYFNSTLLWWKQSWISMAILYGFINSPLIGTLPIGIYLYSQGAIDITKLILALILPLTIIPNAFVLVMSLEIYQMVENNWRMIRKMLNMSEMQRPNEFVQINDNKNFEFKDVCFEYEKDVEVLHNINLKIPQNKVTAIVGESGSGKSTIAKLMVGFFDATKGEILFGDVNVKKMPTIQLMKNISYVAQDNFLFETSLKENLKIAKPDATDEEISNALKMANCDDLISRLPKGIDSDAGDCGKLLSGGERQRITLARAMLSDAKCIILDEATAYADPENEAKIQNALSKIIENKTLIVVAHRLNTIVDADQIIVLDHGNIVANGKHDELIEKSEHYKKLWQHYQGLEDKK